MFTLLAVLAALSFSIGGYFMKLSQGFSQRGPATTMFALFMLGASLQTIAMRHESMTTTYVIVLGLEAVTAFLLGLLFLNESSSPAKIGGIGLIVAGIVLLRGYR
jgi:quaternary ammonium compound-resistance protein SugE